MLLKITALCLFTFCSLKGHSQSAYEIVFLGPYKDSIVFDSTLNWYCSGIWKDSSGHTMQQSILIDIKKDIRQTLQQDSSFVLSMDSSLSRLESQVLIGSKDIVYQRPYKQPVSPVYIPLGHSFEILPQPVFRSLSPCIDFVTTGVVEIQNQRPEVTQFDIHIIYTRDPLGYYKADSLSGQYVKNQNSFVQTITPLIEHFFKKQGLPQKIDYPYIMYCGYIDGDELKDFIIGIRGYNFLFLSYKSNFRNQKIFHLEKAWEDKRYFEF